jgi:hypothetical protein
VASLRHSRSDNCQQYNHVSAAVDTCLQGCADNTCCTRRHMAQWHGQG